MQVVGDFLAIAEQGNGDNRFVRFYRLDKMTDQDKPIRLPVKVKAPVNSSAAMTAYTGEDRQSRHLVAALNNRTIKFYSSNGQSLLSSSLKFDRVFTDELGTDDSQGIGLMTVEDNGEKIYLIAFRSDPRGTYSADKAILYRVDLDRKSIQRVEAREMETEGGSLFGGGVHFRFGAGLMIHSDHEIGFLASERDPGEERLKYNVFKRW